ncbi:MAG: insulinase family protein [Lachnospiraceae bacterium]|nr:insulinase family protein [Lachnospiraceae bacterium]
MFDAYELIREERIEDIHADSYLLRHKKTGARVALLSNEDENKVFNIAFRTPPKNSTGVAHIIEHTVLCGSDKFPLKDPFVELAKGSLNTFLNAMTYPDKTMFPVASCNDADFQNLMDVYLDAVFHPNIYKNEKIFLQEGWHYQLESLEEPLCYNGVVYNEMKGAFSSADEVLDRNVFNLLFPDTPYGVESGGDPDVIPELTYEEFLDFHRTYYHPSNSYIYLYGNMDMEEKLRWIHEEYLSKYDQITVDSEIPMQPAFAERKEMEIPYPVLDDEPLEDNTYLSYSVVVGDGRDVQLNLAFSILEYVLLDAPGAPVKQALLDAGVGQDISGDFQDGILQPFFSITAKNANQQDKERFLSIIEDTLTEIADKGIDQKSLRSGINYFEFRFREADYGSYPKGLMYGLDLFDSWLYDDLHPFAYLKQLDVFENMKKLSSEGYFEQLIRSRLLNNPHGAVVSLVPERGLELKKTEQLQQKLAEKKAAFSAEELEALVKQTRELKEYQESEEKPENLECIPLLKRTDIDRKTPVSLLVEKKEVEGVPVLRHPYRTNGIRYLTLLFDAEQIPDELIGYTSLLKSVLGYVSTENYTYGELFHEINGNSGGIVCGTSIYTNPEAPQGVYRKFGIRSKYLPDQQETVFRLIREIILSSKVEDEKRLKEIISSQKARLQSSIPSAGHSSAARRALAGVSASSGLNERMNGIGYYRLIERLANNFEQEKEDLICKLQMLVHMIFRPENLTVSLNSDEEDGAFEQEIRDLKKVLYTDPVETGSFAWEPFDSNEAIKTSGQVQYVAQTGNFRQAGFAYTGALKILRVIMNYDYLWLNIRVKGGAYGCMSAFSRDGDSYLVSYRDPNLKETQEVFAGLPEYVAGFDADDREMTKYIIGTISELDTPMNASTKGSVALSSYFTGMTVEEYQKEREQILDATAADIRALKALTEAVVQAPHRCVVGSEAAIENNRELFDSVEALIQG